MFDEGVRKSLDEAYVDRMKYWTNIYQMRAGDVIGLVSGFVGWWVWRS